MKRGIIIHRSKHGATKEYVDWLHEITDLDDMETHKAIPNEIVQYEIIVLCGGIYAFGIAGLSFLKKHIVKLRKRKVAVFL